MLFAYYCHTSISYVLLYLFIFVRYFLTFLYIFFLPPLFTSHLLKIVDWQSKAQYFLKLLTRKRLFHSSIMSPGYSSIFELNYIVCKVFQLTSHCGCPNTCLLPTSTTPPPTGKVSHIKFNFLGHS